MEKAKELLINTGKLAVKVTPKARKEGLEGMNDAGELVIKVRAAPEDGKANEAVLALLAEAFGLPRSRLEVARGMTNRHKVITYHAP